MREEKLRRAGAADAEQIAALLREAFAQYAELYTPEAFDATTPAPAEIRRRLLEGTTWVAERSGRLIGTLSTVTRADGVYVRSTAVSPSTRRSGVGRLLLRAAEEDALTQHAARLYLSTTPFLAAAIRLYESAGFLRTAEPPHELLGTPVFTMEKVIHTREAVVGKVSLAIAEHYTWGAGCDGWYMVRHASLSVIRERMPPGAAESRHLHQVARQFFLVLSGVARLEVEGSHYELAPGEGLEVPPGAAHQIFNPGAESLEFLVVSQPHSHGDREAAPGEPT